MIDPSMNALRRLVTEDDAFSKCTLYEADPSFHRLDLETPKERREAQKVESAIDEVIERGLEAYLANCPHAWARVWTPNEEVVNYLNCARG